MGERALACLAFDYKSTQLVELQIITRSEGWTTEQSQAWFGLELLAGLMRFRAPRSASWTARRVGILHLGAGRGGGLVSLFNPLWRGE